MNIFDSIKQQLQIFDVISEQVNLKRAGHYWKGCCPFHHEKTASFTVSPDKEIFYCFGCHEGGDVISFMAKLENCSPIESAKLLVERYQLDIPEDIAQHINSGNLDEKRTYYAICELVAQWCQQSLEKAPAVQRYLMQRGIDRSCINYFSLGYFPVGQRAIKSLLAFMAPHHILVDDLLDANILSKGKTALYSPFEERVIFPIKDRMGHFCGFGGRIFKKQDTRAKYYNSRENSFFNKGALLYGLDLAKESMQKKGSVFLVEGYTDCIAMVQHGYKNTLAVLGTACTAEHLKQVARYIDHVYVLYDGDNAGQQAIMRLTELCWQTNLEVYIISIPKGEDPASCLSKNVDMNQMISNKQDIFRFFINQLGGNFISKPLNQKLQIIRKIIQTIAQLDDPLKRDLLLQHAARTLQMPFDSLKQEMLRTKSSAPQAPVRASSEPDAQPENVKPDRFAPLPKLENKIFCAILNNVSFIGHKYAGNVIRCLPQPYASILKKWTPIASQSPEHAFKILLEQLGTEEKKLVGGVFIAGNEPISAEEFDHLIYQLQKKYWKIVVNDIKIKLETAKKNNNIELVHQLLEDFSALKTRLVELNKSSVSKKDA